MTYGIGGHMPGEEEPADYVIRADDIRGRVQAAYDKLYPTAPTKRADVRYWEGYADGLRDILEELV